MIKFFLYIFTLLYFHLAQAFEVSFVDISNDTHTRERIDLIQNSQNEGIRIHLGGIKEANGEAGPGSVNEAIEEFQKEIKKQLSILPDDDKKSLKKISLVKSDFKGYYLTCESLSPNFNCTKMLKGYLEKTTPKELKVISDKGRSELQVITTASKNYTEGYVNARFMTSYENFKPENDFDIFIHKKTKEIMDLYRENKITKEKLKESIALYRREGLDAITDLNYQKVFFLLDAMEIPFATSNNLEESLLKIIQKTHGTKKLKNGIQISQAFSGDDLYILVKDQLGNNIDLVGADARGLAVANMMSRFEELIEHGNPINSLDELTLLSSKSIERADKAMFSSMDTYIDMLDKKISMDLTDTSKLSNTQIKNKLLETLKKANIEYNQIANTDPNLMNMRAARIDPKNIKVMKDLREAMDQIAKLHKKGKNLEEKGIIKVITVDDLQMMQYFGKLRPVMLIPECLRGIMGNNLD